MKHVAFKAGLKADLLVLQNRKKRRTATMRHMQGAERLGNPRGHKTALNKRQQTAPWFGLETWRTRPLWS
jgi:hypothetical protein